MKKIIVTIMAAVMMLVCLAGCSAEEALNIHEKSKIYNVAADEYRYEIDGESVTAEEFYNWSSEN